MTSQSIAVPSLELQARVRLNRIHADAPARINVIGEHTDYTGGLVLPMAIPFVTTAQISSSSNGEYVFASDGFPDELRLSCHQTPCKMNNWSDYPVGVLTELQKMGIHPPPFKVILKGNVPLGAGLSSSASLEVATCIALLDWSGAMLPADEIALLCQRAENLFVGSPCGIMDQFASAAAVAGHALLLNTRNLSFELIPMNHGQLADTCIVVCNSQIRHSVADGEYGNRRREVEAGQTILCSTFPEVEDLGMASLAHLDEARDRMSVVSYLRCRHIISENDRVRAAREAMTTGDAEGLGKLMLSGHVSERDDFACSCEEIDFLVDTAISLPGCYGARLTGGGFGGCTVNLVETSKANEFRTSLQNAYWDRYQVHAQAWICEPVDGAIARTQHANAPERIDG